MHINDTMTKRAYALLSIVIPAHNEAENIVSVIQRVIECVDFPYEVIVVDDHSIDTTAALVTEISMKNTNIRLVRNQFQNGFANALKSGFNHSLGDAAVPVMADLCDDPALLKPMFEKLQEGYDVVCASRYSPGGARLGGSRLKGFLSRMAGTTAHFLLGIPTRDIANSYKMYRKDVIDAIKIQAGSFEISMEMVLKAYFSGFKIAEVSTVWNERTRGKSSFRMLKLLPCYAKVYSWAFMKKIRG